MLLCGTPVLRLEEGIIAYWGLANLLKADTLHLNRTKFSHLFDQAFTVSMHWYFLLMLSLSSAIGFRRSLTPARLFSAKAVKTVSGTKRLGTVFPGHVYFVATPIGNLQDITVRAKETLVEADYVCAEDTRHTINLLRLLQIPHKQMISHHEHNHHSSIPYIVDLALSGKSIAVVSDAGTPGISDPGTELAAALAKANVPIHPVPGPSAVISALSISGFPCSPFTFYGFLPAKGTARKEMLKQIYDTKHTLVLYEAPHRIQRTLQDIASYTPSDADNSVLSTEHVSMGNRVCVCCRELTKVHEQISRGTVNQVLQGLIQSAGDRKSTRLNSSHTATSL